jgi:hypothetical protein
MESLRLSRHCIQKTLDALEAKGGELKRFRAVFGFDGFVDILAIPIKKGNSLQVEQVYSTIGEFGAFLVERSEKSCSIELKELETKLGGNAPIAANALGSLGTGVTCIGAFGYPQIHTAFRSMSPSCELVSVENPGTCTALEFTDGKVMLAMNNGLNSLDWVTVRSRVGVEQLTETIAAAELLGMVNWSELPGATGVWRGILHEIMPHVTGEKWIVFDLSDCTRKSESELSEALQLVSDYGRQFKTVISLNENEAKAVLKVLCADGGIMLEEAGIHIRRQLGIHSVVFHLHDRCMAFEETRVSQFETHLIKEPVITTGAGDNFNAGLCAALLLDMDMPEVLASASLTASFYVANGYSPALLELLGFMKEESHS